MSGIPKTLEFELNRIDGFYPIGRGTEGRTSFLHRLDLYGEYNLQLTDRYALQFNVNVENVFNTSISTRYFMLVNQGLAYLDDDEMLPGFNYQSVIADQDVTPDPRFNQEYYFQSPITARIGIKFIF
jgi:hypothetical protein